MQNKDDEKIVLEKQEEIIQNIEQETFIKRRKTQRHKEAKDLVKKSKGIVSKIEQEEKLAKLMIDEILFDYEETKFTLKKGGLNATISLLVKLGFNTTYEKDKEAISTYEPPLNMKTIKLKNILSGRFTGVIYGLISAIIIFIGLIYIAMSNLDIVFDSSNMPSAEAINNILNWFPSIIGLKADSFIGAIILFIICFSIVMTIYILHTNKRAKYNFSFASKQLGEAEIYTQYKTYCIKEMSQIDLHIKEVIILFKIYRVLLNEQKGKLQRILFIEGVQEETSLYHNKSLIEINITKELISSIQNFILTAVAIDGKLSKESINSLKELNSTKEKLFQKLY